MDTDDILDSIPRFPETLVLDPLSVTPTDEVVTAETTGRGVGPTPPPWATLPSGPQTEQAPFPSSTSPSEPSFPSIPSPLGPPPTSPFSFPQTSGPESPGFPTSIHPFTQSDVTVLLQEIARKLDKPEPSGPPSRPTGPLPGPTQYVWEKSTKARQLPDRPEVVIED